METARIWAITERVTGSILVNWIPSRVRADHSDWWRDTPDVKFIISLSNTNPAECGNTNKLRGTTWCLQNTQKSCIKSKWIVCYSQYSESFKGKMQNCIIMAYIWNIKQKFFVFIFKNINFSMLFNVHMGNIMYLFEIGPISVTFSWIFFIFVFSHSFSIKYSFVSFRR